MAPLNTFSHIAFSCNSGIGRIFVGGILKASAARVGAMPAPLDLFTVGNGYGYSAGNQFTGQIDELRITKGTGLYTVNFTPPTGPFPDS